MGKNLTLNIESRGYSVSVFNRSSDKTENFLNKEAVGRIVVGTNSILLLVQKTDAS